MLFSTKILISFFALLAFPSAILSNLVDVSVQCLDESNVLYNNTALAAVRGISTAFECDFTAASKKCAVDFGKFNANYTAACQAATGRFNTSDVTFNCRNRSDGSNYKIYNDNYGFCLGASCTAAEFVELRDNAILQDDLDLFASQGYTCTFVVGNIDPSVFRDGNTVQGSVSAGSKAGSAFAFFSVLSVMAAFILMY